MGAPRTHLEAGIPEKDMAIEAPAAGTSLPDADPAEGALRARVLARVVAGIVHDIRTPLGTMLMKLQLLRDSIAGEAGLSETVAGHLRVLDAQIERMTEMVRKVASTVDPPTPLGSVDLGTLVADVVGALGYEAKLRTVELSVEPRTVAVRTPAEPSGVGRLVLCLLGRAIAGTPQGGRVVTRAVTRGGAAVVEVDHTANAGEASVGYDVDVLTTSAIALGGRLERGPGDQGLERLTLTLPGNERR
jgi:signal transduction histidine kinase